MLSSSAIQTRFVIAVLCPAADYSDLLAEARRQKLVILEIIPFSRSFTGYERYMAAGTAVLFVCGKNEAVLVEQESDLHPALQACNCTA